jgi:hypothetical protein
LSNKLKILSILLAGTISGCSDPPAKQSNVEPSPPARHQVKEDFPSYIYEGKVFNIGYVGSNDPKLKEKRDAEMRRVGSGYADMMAALSGTLKISNGCLVIGSAGGGNDTMIAFRGGEYSWDNQAGTLTYRGKSYKIGDAVNFGGGDFNTGDSKVDTAARAALFAYDCDVSESIFFVN